jgi:hypothetical protein
VRTLLILAVILATAFAGVANAAHGMPASGSGSAMTTAAADADHGHPHDSSPASGHAGHCDVCGHGLGLSLIPMLAVAPDRRAREAQTVDGDLSVVAIRPVDRIDEPPR